MKLVVVQGDDGGASEHLIHLLLNSLTIPLTCLHLLLEKVVHRVSANHLETILDTEHQLVFVHANCSLKSREDTHVVLSNVSGVLGVEIVTTKLSQFELIEATTDDCVEDVDSLRIVQQEPIGLLEDDSDQVSSEGVWDFDFLLKFRKINNFSRNSIGNSHSAAILPSGRESFRRRRGICRSLQSHSHGAALSLSYASNPLEDGTRHEIDRCCSRLSPFQSG